MRYRELMPFFSIYTLSKEINISARRIAYFAKHIERCKRDEDRIKLTIMVVAEFGYVTACINQIKNEAKQAIEMVFPKPKERVIQKLLN